MPTHQHAQSPTNYTPPPPLRLATHTVRCAFGCSTVVASTDLTAVIDAIAAHYADAHPLQHAGGAA